jgi:selenocysteine lyase/cysteine desulfurase
MTATPLPSWQDLLPQMSGGVINDNILADPWRVGEQEAIWFSRSAWALELIAEWVLTIEQERRPVIWVPDFFCNQSLEPLRSKNVKIEFYPIQADLEPNWQTCRQMVQSGKPDLFLLVHYFGYGANVGAAKEFCDEFGVYLIEDGAHAIGPSEAIGQIGDFVIYSPYKFFAVPDGGLLLIRNKNIAKSVREIFAAKRQGAPASLVWKIKRFIQKIMPQSLLRFRAAKANIEFNVDPPTYALARQRNLSPYARRLLSSVASMQARICAMRKQNALKIRAKIETIENCSALFSAEEEGAVPYRFVLKVEDNHMAIKMFNQLRLLGWPVESWPDLAPEVLAAPEKYSAAIKLRQTTLLLPIHHTLDLNPLIRPQG